MLEVRTHTARVLSHGSSDPIDVMTNPRFQCMRCAKRSVAVYCVALPLRCIIVNVSFCSFICDFMKSGARRSRISKSLVPVHEF